MTDEINGNEQNIVKKKHYPPSYYRYHGLHKTISITYDIETYKRIMKCFGGTGEIKQVLLNIASGKDVNVDVTRELEALQKKYDALMKSNKILISRLHDENED